MPSTLALDSRLLAAVEDLPLLANLIVEGFLDGLHRSPFLGYSTEFSAYRAYTQGDNLRHIDWKVWARTDELYVKQFEDDTNLRCQIYLDTSASMDFGGAETNKFLYGRLLAAALSQLMVRQRDAPGLVLFGSESRLGVPAQAVRHQPVEILTLLARTRATGGTRLGSDLMQWVQSFTRRGMAVIISDFFAADEEVFEFLRQLRAQRQEILVLHLLAPEEEDLPLDGEFILEDSESGEEILVHADDARAGYRRRLEEFVGHIREECLRMEADYVRLRTDQPLDVALTAYLERRLAL
ncbi:MAG: DUF58 domain-containing protein [Verrucomicrobiales bacterium]|nr:DUF58 domain-containing protein [Verrucomicrobiales bacterium]